MKSNPHLALGCLWLGMMVGGSAAAAQAPQAPTAAPPSGSNLTLPQAEQLALLNHPQLQSAQLSALALRQDTREARSAYYPTATANLTGAEAENGSRLAAGLLNNPSVYSRQADGISVNQLITDFGRTSSLVQSSQLHAQAGQAGAAATRQQIVLGADVAYFEALRAQALQAVADQTVTERQQVRQQVSALAQAQLRSDLDLSMANTYLAQAKLDQAQAQSQVLAAQAELGLALGLPGPADYRLEEPPLAAQPPSDVQALLDQALALRPEMAEFRLQDQSEARFAAAEGDLARPTLSAAGAAGFVPWGEAPLTDRYAAVGVNLSIPVFNGFDFAARHQAATLRAQAAQQDLRTVQDEILRDVRVAWLQARTAFATLDLTQQFLDQAQRGFDLAHERYQVGVGNIVELSQAQLSLTQALNQHAGAIYDFQAANARLQFQIGATP